MAVIFRAIQRLQTIPRPKKFTALLIFLILLISYGYFFPRWASWSQNSRLNLVMAIGDEGSLSIDRFCRDQGGLSDENGKAVSECENTGDYAKFNGHFYSDKAPGVAFAAVPSYLVFKLFAALPPVQALMARLAHSKAFESTLKEGGSGLQSEKIYYALALYFVTVCTIAIPAALLGVLLYDTQLRLGYSPRLSLLVTLIFGLATPAFAYGGMLFSHQLSAFLLFASFYLAFAYEPKRLPSGWMTVCGLLLGWAVIAEYPNVLIAAGIGIYIWQRQGGWRVPFWLALGALLPGVLLMAYDYAIFGTVLPVGYQYSPLYTQEGGAHEIGLLSLTYPHLDALWGITFGSLRGLFFLSPILLLAVGGFYVMFRSGKRAEWWLSVWAVLSFLLFNGSSAMWQGGFAVGPRYLLPMLPFLMLGLAPAWAACEKSRVGRVGLVILSAWSLLAVWIETIGGQSFPDWTPNPLFNYSLPYLLNGNVARNLAMALGLRGIWSVIPLWIISAGLGWFTYQQLEHKEAK